MLADLGMQRFDVNHRIVALGTEHVRSTSQQQMLPVDDLVRRHVMRMGQLGPRFLAANGMQRHFGLNAGQSVRRGLFFIFCSS